MRFPAIHSAKHLFRVFIVCLCFLLTRINANAQWCIDPELYVYQYPYDCGSGSGEVTLAVNYYNVDGHNLYGFFRWYNSETGGLPFWSSLISSSDYNITSTVNLPSDNEVTVWVSFDDRNTGCESQRIPYTYTPSPPPQPSFYYSYAFKCGNGPAKIQVGSYSTSSFTLYKLVDNGYEYYHYIESNSTGHFEVPDYDLNASYFVMVPQPCGGNAYYQIYLDYLTTDPPNVSGNLSIITGSATTLSTYGFSELNWYDAGGNFLNSGASFTTPALTATTTYQVRGTNFDATNGSCISDPRSVTVKVTPPPPPPFCDPELYVYRSNPALMCREQDATLTVELYNPNRVMVNGYINWYYTETGGQTFNYSQVNSNEPVITGTATVRGIDNRTIWVSFQNPGAGCETARVPYTFHITPQADVFWEYALQCGNTAKVKLKSLTPGVGFSLYTLNATNSYSVIESNSTGIFEITNYNPGVQYYATAGVSGECAPLTYTPVYFDVFNTDPPQVVGDINLPDGASTTLGVSGFNIDKVRWYDANGNILAEGHSFTTPVLTPDTYTYQVRAYSLQEVCVSDLATVTVSVNLPAITYTEPFNSGNFSRTIDLSKPVGKIAGEAGTSGSGGATYSIPVYTPPGTNKMSPAIAVSYSSQSGNGVAGYGWNISGLSVIGRTGKDMYHNGMAAPVTLTDQDAFILDGMRLNAITGANGANGTIYAGENENYSQIISYGGSASNPDWFKVIGKDGASLEYGNSTDSRIFTDDGANVVMWRLNKIIDINGNYVEFKYTSGFRDSRIDEIKYTGNINTGLAPYNSIKFNYRERTDVATTFSAGASFKTKHLLSTITVTSENNLVKTYQFNYAYDNLYSLLKEVVETAYDGTSLNSTIFQYGDQQASSLQYYTSDALTGSYDFYSGDFNADGKTDLLAAKLYYDGGVKFHSSYQLLTDLTESSATILYMKDLDQSAGTSVAPSGSFSNFLTSDYNGDGRDDVMHVRTSKPGSAREYYNTTINYTGGHNGSTGWTDYNAVDYGVPSAAGIQYKYLPDNGSFIFNGDFDGDGNKDYILLLGRNKTSGDPSVNGNYIFKAFLTNTVTGEINQEIANFGVPSSANNAAYGNSVATANLVTPFDFDGDGKDELLVTNNYGSYVLSINRVSAASGYLFNAASIGYTNKIYPNSSLFPGDFNGDGKTDFLDRASDGSWWLEYSTGKDFVEIPFSFSPGVSWSGAENDHKIVVSDFNGDGKSDILHGYMVSNTSTSKFNIYYSNGTISSASFLKEEFTYNNLLAARTGVGFVSGDFNGDGRSDLMNRINIWSGGDLVTFNANGKERMLAKVKDGYNGTYSFQYQLLTDKTTNPDFYNRTVSLDGPENTPPFNYVEIPVYAVSGFTKPNGIPGNDDITSYTYENAVLHRHGKGFLGFRKVITNEVTQGVTTIVENQINTDFAISYTAKQSHRLNSNNALLKENTFNYTFVPLSTGPNDPKRFFQKTDKALSVNYLTGSAVESVNTYGSYANIDLNVKKTGTPGGSTVNAVETITTATTYIASGTPVASLPEQVTVTRSRNGAGSNTDVTRFTYNAGLMTTKTSFYGLPKAVTTTFGYDGLGNVTSTNTTAAGVAPRVTNTTFDSKGRFEVTKQMAAGTAIEQTESFVYDGRWGSPLSSTTTDCFTSTFEYDAFGRQKKATGPVFTTNFSMGWDVTGNKLYYCLSDFTGGKSDSKVWYDMQDREVSKQVAGFNNQWLTTNTTYDVRGNESTTTNAYYSNETPIVTTKTYDAYNRQQTLSNGLSSVQFTYSLSGGNLVVTTTDQDGHVSSKTTDAAGRVVASNDKGGDLYFSYDGRGLQTETKHGSTVVLTGTYDDYGRKTSQVDKNAGTLTYVYDAFSQLITETDNSNHTYQLAYDELGRMISRQGPEGTTTYEYYKDNATGCANNNLKKSIGFNGVIKEYVYDNLMRVATETATIDAVPYVTTYGYDTYSNVNKITYPSGIEVNKVYDNNGNLTQVTGGSPGAQTTLFNASQKNGFGVYTAYTLANNRTSQLTFENGFPKQFYTQNIQDLNFTWDYANKNLMSRQDLLKGVTENFQYDALNRLTQTAVTGQPPMNITYDGSSTFSMGNIATKTDAGNYTYRNDKIHAVAYITNPTAISNSTVGQVITYTPFLKTETISENDYQIAFTYGPEYQRVKSVLQYQNVVAETKIFAGDYEKFTDNTGTKEIHYIQGGNGLCAIIVKENGGNNIYVPYTDYLGSILTVTDVNGNIVAEQNFDAWGRKRNPQDWTYNNIPTVQTWLYRGFTGHEHLPQFALINMNGRLYDPIQGRMISPDVYVAGLYDSQGYNRYSYANNNPLSYVDPDGNFILFALGNLIAHAIRGDVHDIGDAFNYFGQGAVAGLFSGGGALPLVNPLTWLSVGRGLVDGIFNGNWTTLDNAGRIFLGNYYLDENRTFMGGVIQGVSRHTWEIIQTTIGYSYTQLRNTVGNVDGVTFFGGATFAWRFNMPGDQTGVTMGSYINMRINGRNTNIIDPVTGRANPLYMHEFGHTIQSQYWGLLYPFLVMIPSPISAATARPLPGWPALDTHDTRWYEMQANRYASRYFGRRMGINWNQYEPRNGGNYPTRNP